MVGWLFLAKDNVRESTHRQYTANKDLAKVYGIISAALEDVTDLERERIVDFETRTTICSAQSAMEGKKA
jgi:hypothetical protein